MKYKVFGLGLVLGLALVLQTGFTGVQAESNVYSTNGNIGFVGKYPEKNRDIETDNKFGPYFKQQNYKNGRPVLPDTGDIPILQNILIPFVLLGTGISLLVFRKYQISRSS